MGASSDSVCFTKTDVNKIAMIRATFITRKPISELGFINYKGEKSLAYGVKGIVLIVNSSTVFSGEVLQNSATAPVFYSLRLFINQLATHSSSKQIHAPTTGQNGKGITSLAQKRQEELPSLVKHKSQDISVVSQQSDTSSGKVRDVD